MIWTPNEHRERFDALPKNRQALIAGYVRRHAERHDARRNLQRVSRKLTPDEWRIAELIALEAQCKSS